MRAGVKGPRSGLFSSRKVLRGHNGKLKQAVDTKWVPAGTGLMRLRTDSYKMSRNISKDHQKVFERSGIRLKKGLRPYSHKISGNGKYGPITGSETAHGVERRQVPKAILAKAARGRLSRNSPEFKRYFR